MKTQCIAIAAIAFLAMPLALIGAAKAASQMPSAQRASQLRHAAFIYNMGVDDFAGFRIAVDPSGKAWAIDGGGQTSGELAAGLAGRFFRDLNAAGPLRKLPNQSCSAAQPGIQFTTNVNAPLIITWNGQSSPDLSCALDPRAQNLRFDAATIQRALAVQSYRVRRIVFGESNTANAQSTTGGYQQPHASYFSDYAFNGNGYSNVSSSSMSSGYGSSCGCGGNTFDAGRFNAGRFSNEPFSNGGFTVGRFGNSGFSTERFNTESFNSFNFSSSDFRNTTFYSGFSANFGYGAFGSSGFGNGGFTTPSYTNGGFGGSGFGNGNFTGVPAP